MALRTDPTGPDPAGTDREGTDPRGTDPTGTDPRGTDPTGTDPRGTDPAGTDPNSPERGLDRRRRREDAVRLVPVLGVLLFLFPLLLAGSAGWTTAWIGIYLFGAWAALIALIGWLSRRLERRARPPHDEAAR